MARRTEWFTMGLMLAALAAILAVAADLTSERGVLAPGSEAPVFRAVSVESGATATLADYWGHVVLLNIWATWCRPCEEEMPSMQRLYDELGPHGFEVVAVSIDRGSAEAVLQWVRERNLTFDILHDPKGRIQRVYQTTGVPESFVIDRTGTILKRQIGAYEWDGPVPRELFRRWLGLAESPSASQTP